MPTLITESRRYITEITNLSFTEEEVIDALINYYNLPKSYEGIRKADHMKLRTYDNFDKMELDVISKFPVELVTWYEYQDGEF